MWHHLPILSSVLQLWPALAEIHTPKLAYTFCSFDIHDHDYNCEISFPIISSNLPPPLAVYFYIHVNLQMPVRFSFLFI